MADLGIGSIGIGDDGDDDEDDDDESLEAELAALQEDSQPKVKRKSKHDTGKFSQKTLMLFRKTIMGINKFTFLPIFH